MWVAFVWIALPGIARGAKARIGTPAEALDWSADSRYVVAGSVDGGAVRVDVRNKATAVALDGLGAVQLSPEGRLVLGVKGDAFVSVDLETDGVEEIPLPEMRGRPVAWMRGPFGDVVVTKTVAHYNIRRTGGRSSDADAAPTRNFRTIWLDPEQPLAYVDTGFGLEVRHLRTGLTLRTLDSGRKDQEYVGVVRDPEGRLILAVEDEDGFRLWTPPDRPGTTWEIEAGAPKSISGDGQQLAVGGETGVTVYGTALQDVRVVLKTKAAVVRVALSPDGQYVAAALVDGSVKVWPVPTDGLELPLERKLSDVDVGRIREDILAGGEELTVRAATGRYALSGATTHLSWAPTGWLSGWVGGELVQIDPASGDEVAMPMAGIAPGRPYAWSSDGTRIAAVTDSGVGVYDTRRWRLVRPLATGGAHNQLGWQGPVLTVDAGSGSAQSWNPAKGTPEGEAFVFSAEAVSRFELSPDGAALAVTGRAGRVLASADGKPIASLDAQWGGVVTACWSPDGSHLATAGADGTVLVWDTSTWTPSSLIEGASGREMAFSPDGTKLVSASWDGGVVANVTSGALEQMLAFDGLLGSVDWGPAGIAMVDTSGNLYLWSD